MRLRARFAAVLGFAIALAVTGGVVIRAVQAATYVGPTVAPPGGNIPVTIWNRTATTVKQTNAAIDIDGGGPAAAATTVGTTPVGLAVGSATLNMGSADAGQNLIYGVADYTKINAADYLIRLQTVNAAVYADRFRVDRNGNAYLASSLNTSSLIATANVMAGSTVLDLGNAAGGQYVERLQARYGGMHPQDYLLLAQTYDSVTALTTNRFTIDRDGSVLSTGTLAQGVSTLDLGVAAAGQNVYYGVADYTKMHAADYLMLLQTYDPGTTSYATRAVVDRDGNITAGGNLNASGCFGPTFVGTTNLTFDGALNTTAPNNGYYNATLLCNAASSGSHVCSVAEMLNSLKCATTGSPIKAVGVPDAWIQGGPPGYPAIANDCRGWTSNFSGAPNPHYGRFWRFDPATGGMGNLTTCNSLIRFACCK